MIPILVPTVLSGRRVNPNLLAQPIAFDNAAWTKTELTVTANQAVAPDGTTTAELAVPTTLNNQHIARQSVTHAANATYTLSLYAKPNGYNFVYLRALARPDPNRAWFNLSTGAAGTVNAGLTAAIRPAANGYYRCSITFTTPGTISFDLVEFGISAADASSTWIGDGASGVYLWNGKLEIGPITT